MYIIPSFQGLERRSDRLSFSEIFPGKTVNLPVATGAGHGRDEKRVRNFRILQTGPTSRETALDP
jgi:hypothetical protein